MNPSVRFEPLRAMTQLRERCPNPGDDSVPWEHCSGEQVPPQNAGSPFVPDPRAFESFIDGTGI